MLNSLGRGGQKAWHCSLHPPGLCAAWAMLGAVCPLCLSNQVEENVSAASTHKLPVVFSVKHEWMLNKHKTYLINTKQRSYRL